MKPSIVFLGSGPVAAKSLELLADNFDIEAVITKPTTAKEMTAAAKKTCVYTVNSRGELDDLISADQFQSPLAVLVDFGIIVSQEVVDYFPLGIVNSHFSLLPQWRGADPITSAILSGQTKTGVSLMMLVENMDEGPLLAQTSLPIEDTDTGPSLTDKLIKLSDQMLKAHLPEYISGKLKAQPQPSQGATYSRKLTKQDGIIDWNEPAEQIEREIRAFIDWPKSRTKLGEIEMIITKAHTVPSQPVDSKPGDIEVILDAGAVMVASASGSICIDSLKPAGKKEMTAAEFIRGYASRIGTKAQ